MKSRIAQRGDIYWLDPNPIVGREMQNRHRFVVITVKEINALGMVTMVPITSGGSFARHNGLTVHIMGRDTQGVAVCNQLRSFDLQARIQAGTASYVETLDESLPKKS
jgi:mRNA interferase ChpB